jgi:branched-chain amino acid transport system permease protein
MIENNPLEIKSFSRASTVFLICLGFVLIIFYLAPFWGSRADLRLLSEFFLFLTLASLWNLLAGFAGLVSVGQQAYVGFGGYFLFGAAMFLGFNPFVCVPLAFLIGMLVSMPVAVLIFRLNGAYFAIGTWVIAEVFRLIFAQVSSLGGGSGSSLPVVVVKKIASDKTLREHYSFWVALTLFFIVFSCIYFLLRSKHGLALKAIRDSELSAKSIGVNIWKTKFLVYVFTAGATAATGALIFLQKLRISPDAAFSVNDWTAFIIFVVVIGGIGTIEGPIIGTIIYFILRETLADLGSYYLIILGVLAIGVMLRFPTGIWGAIKERYSIELFPLTRKVSKFTDTLSD